jgi:hypothetical protein
MTEASRSAWWFSYHSLRLKEAAMGRPKAVATPIAAKSLIPTSAVSCILGLFTAGKMKTPGSREGTRWTSPRMTGAGLRVYPALS